LWASQYWLLPIHTLAIARLVLARHLLARTGVVDRLELIEEMDRFAFFRAPLTLVVFNLIALMDTGYLYRNSSGLRMSVVLCWLMFYVSKFLFV